MLRAILRNVQTSLIAASCLLVLVAFRRGLWMPPLHSSGYATLPYSDEKDAEVGEGQSRHRIFAGSESRDIGWVSFDVGLFRFMLPSFARSSSFGSSSATVRGFDREKGATTIKTVPPPPSRWRVRGGSGGQGMKKTKKKVVTDKDGRDDNKQAGAEVRTGRNGRDVAEEEGRTHQVAYVVSFPPCPSSEGDDDDGAKNKNVDAVPPPPLMDVAAVLAESIRRSHDRSSASSGPDGGVGDGKERHYEHRLFALVDGGDATAPPSCREALSKLGYEVVATKAATTKAAMKTKEEEVEVRLRNAIFQWQGGGQDRDRDRDRDIPMIVMRLPWNGMVVGPLDDIFDSLLMVPVPSVKAKMTTSGGRDRLLRIAKEGKEELIGAYAVDDGGLFVFRTGMAEEDQYWAALVEPIVSVKKPLPIPAMELLDRCSYYAGSDDDPEGTTSCKGQSLAEVRVVRFEVERRDDGSSDGRCPGPWECIKDGNNDVSPISLICRDLHHNWFRLMNELEKERSPKRKKKNGHRPTASAMGRHTASLDRTFCNRDEGG